MTRGIHAKGGCSLHTEPACCYAHRTLHLRWLLHMAVTDVPCSMRARRSGCKARVHWGVDSKGQQRERGCGFRASCMQHLGALKRAPPPPPSSLLLQVVIDLTQGEGPLGAVVNADYDPPMDPKEEAAREQRQQRAHTCTYTWAHSPARRHAHVGWCWRARGQRGARVCGGRRDVAVECHYQRHAAVGVSIRSRGAGMLSARVGHDMACVPAC